LEKLKSLFAQYYEKARQHKKIIWFILAVLAVAFVIYTVIWCYNLIFAYPVDQVSQITNVSEKADLVNKYRTTSVQIVAIIAQIFGAIAIFFGLFFAWGNLTTAREGQITERFTRAIDQLGNRKMEIRLGGIYALERIANESEKDYWSIMEILTAYVRNNSGIDSYSKDISLKNVPISMDIQANESNKNKVPKIRTISLDIQAILTVIVRRKYSYEHGETNELDFKETNLQQANLSKANLSEADLIGANLSEAELFKANLSEAELFKANLSEANLSEAELSEADLSKANLSGANLSEAELFKANCSVHRLTAVSYINSHGRTFIKKQGSNYGFAL
jgi:Pentapeptide repeats (8 copies)